MIHTVCIIHTYIHTYIHTHVYNCMLIHNTANKLLNKQSLQVPWELTKIQRKAFNCCYPKSNAKRKTKRVLKKKNTKYEILFMNTRSYWLTKEKFNLLIAHNRIHTIVMVISRNLNDHLYLSGQLDGRSSLHTFLYLSFSLLLGKYFYICCWCCCCCFWVIHRIASHHIAIHPSVYRVGNTRQICFPRSCILRTYTLQRNKNKQQQQLYECL